MWNDVFGVLDEITGWNEGILPRVRDRATKVGKTLESNGVGEPCIFTNGPESVVFTWEGAGQSNAYLTISESCLSALYTTPEKIVWRWDGIANES